MKLLARLLVVAVTAALCAVLLRGLRLEEVTAALRRADWRLVALAVFANLTFNTGARVYRFRALLGRLPRADRGAGWWELCSLLLASYAASNLLPARAGEALRTVQLNRRHGYTVGALVGAQLFEKLIEGLSLGLLALPAAIWAEAPGPLRVPLFAFAALGVGGVTALFVLGRFVFSDGPSAVEEESDPAPGGSRRLAITARRFLRRLGDGIRLLHATPVWGRALAWSCASDLADGAMIGLCLHAIGLPLPIGSWVVVLLAINLAIALPSTPAQVGVFEAGAVLALKAFGVPEAPALAFAVVYHAAHVVPTTAAGLVGLRLLSWRDDAR